MRGTWDPCLVPLSLASASAPLIIFVWYWLSLLKSDEIGEITTLISCEISGDLAYGHHKVEFISNFYQISLQIPCLTPSPRLAPSPPHPLAPPPYLLEMLPLRRSNVKWWPLQWSSVFILMWGAMGQGRGKGARQGQGDEAGVRGRGRGKGARGWGRGKCKLDIFYWRYSFRYSRRAKFKPVHWLHNKSNLVKMVKTYRFDPDLAHWPITFSIKLRLNPHGTPQERWNLTLQGKKFPNKYWRGTNLTKYHLAKYQTSTPNVSWRVLHVRSPSLLA